MKSFAFSKKFFIPFIIAFVLYAGIILAQFWHLYSDDFVGKGIPFSVKFNFLFYQLAGDIGSLILLLSILLAAVYYSHRSRDVAISKFFVRNNIIAIGVIALAGFFYVSFYQPFFNAKSINLLMEVYYTKKGETFKPSKEEGYRNEKMFSLAELFLAKDSIKQQLQKRKQAIAADIKSSITMLELDEAIEDLNKMKAGINGDDIKNAPGTFSKTEAWRCCTKSGVEIALASLNATNTSDRKFNYYIVKYCLFPFYIVMFFIAGFVFGKLWDKVHVSAPLLIANFVLYPAWYYCQVYFQRKYLSEKSGIVVLLATIFIMTILVCIGYYFLKKKKSSGLTEEVVL